MLIGLPGVGKSTFAARFSETFNATYVNYLDIQALARDDESLAEEILNFYSITSKAQADYSYRRPGRYFGRAQRNHDFCREEWLFTAIYMGTNRYGNC